MWDHKLTNKIIQPVSFIYIPFDLVHSLSHYYAVVYYLFLLCPLISQQTLCKKYAISKEIKKECRITIFIFECIQLNITVRYFDFYSFDQKISYGNGSMREPYEIFNCTLMNGYNKSLFTKLLSI